ncbi:MAG: secretion protein HylD [Massilia sp.]|jgi:hemolysin D|nr:secretion protein HylD [Massilia sp.]
MSDMSDIGDLAGTGAAPSSWHDPLGLLRDEAPRRASRIVLLCVCVLTLALGAWAAVGEIDIIASADGRLVPQTLVKVVQPAEAGVVRELLVREGDRVAAGQVLARLDSTVADAEQSGVGIDLAKAEMSERRLLAALSGAEMGRRAGDSPTLFAQDVQALAAHRRAMADTLGQERALFDKVGHERSAAIETRRKLEQTLPTYQEAARNFTELARQGYAPVLQGVDKQREAVEKQKDLDAQRSAVAALDAAVAAQRQKISQIDSADRNALEKELADTRARIAQLRPNLQKSVYRQGQLALRAPQAGEVKDLATTTVGAVVQPGSVVVTLVPQGELLYADVDVQNADVGFVTVGQAARIKLAAYPFQRYGTLTGKVLHLSADASEPNRAGNAAPVTPSYKARIALDRQDLRDGQGRSLHLSAGMQVVVEINQGHQTVLEYLLSPVRKTLAEAGHER